MIKIKNKFIGAFLVGVLSIGALSGALIKTQDTKIVYAVESKALQDAKAKINHLTSSLKTNYLGIKNQRTWQIYIGESRELISKIPSSERAQRDALTVEVNKDESLVNGLARINQVEKSIQPKSEGGYGNYLGIKNAETWNEYLRLAKIDLEKVDKSIFQKQYDKLISRMEKVSVVVKDIEDKFQVEYNKVMKMFDDALEADNVDMAKEALRAAELLGTCDRSDNLKKDIKKFIYETPREITLTFGKGGYVGKDIPIGRYVCTSVSESASFIVTNTSGVGTSINENLVSSKGNSKGVSSVTCDLKDGQSILIGSNDSIKLTPVQFRKPMNTLSTGSWEVGKDIDSGNYVVTVTPGFEKLNTTAVSGINILRNNSNIYQDTLNYNSEWKDGFEYFSVNLQVGDKINISNLHSLTFTKKIG